MHIGAQFRLNAIGVADRIAIKSDGRLMCVAC